MGKYMRKCKGIGETVMEVAQVGVTTRARSSSLAMEAEGTEGTATSTGATKRRKVVSAELQFSPSCVQLSSPLPVITPERSVSPANSENSDQVITEERCSSPNSDHVQVSQCSSNGSTELVKESLRSVDLEDEDECFHIENLTKYSDCRQSRETTPSSELRAESGDLESTARPSAVANSRYRSTDVRMPTETELDEFFSAAEKKEQKRFADKYNFDIMKDVPLEGRYEWVRVKP
ncbi:cyclin-dependent kinase inhibitor 1-like [Macadamia integrifolia]|uniref:cyclin-dependent kinase inhibitor 1-like n=1 Tax=Macadamia integrifolia TaxID=60698 RepID=UPI001C4F8965|nr:cyclin-dependent kinase inhibitor 1-like [Macadamia integrifolia]